VCAILNIATVIVEPECVGLW